MHHFIGPFRLPAAARIALLATGGSLLASTAVLAQNAASSPKLKPSQVEPAAVAPATPAVVAPAGAASPLSKSPDVGHAAGAPDPKDAAAAKAGLVATGQWSATEIEQAQNACVALLKTLDVVAVGSAPIKDGDCGAAAPIELISVGKVTFSPPAIVTCDMAAALHKWVTSDLQPLARKHLGAPLTRIDTMSSYSCRTAYGRRFARLSEHGRANALDIRAFVTAKAEPADVLAHWGPTGRDIAAQVAAAKAAAQKQPTQTAQPAAVPGVTTAPGSNPVAAGGVPSTVADTARPGVTIGLPGVPGGGFPSGTSAIGLSNGLPPASRLGGPKPPPEQVQGKAAAQAPAPAPAPAPATALRTKPVADPTEGRMLFLKGAHTSACRIFGTTLGPEANNAHRNHFHVDMAKRQLTNFCE